MEPFSVASLLFIAFSKHLIFFSNLKNGQSEGKVFFIQSVQVLVLLEKRRLKQRELSHRGKT
jgi:hypothetical protein